MSRMSLAATSLVAAIPAGIMAALGIMAFLSHTEHMQPLVMAMMAVATLMGIVVALMPAVILVGKGQSKPKAASKKGKKESAASGVSGAQTAEIVNDDLADEAADEFASEEIDEADETEAFSDDMSGSTGEFQFEDDAFLDDELADADLEPEPEPEPKKKKKKKR